MHSRKCIRILLVNPQDQILMMRAVDPTTTNLERTQRDAFWCTVGGKIEGDETTEQAAHRELFEETGIAADQVSWGPIVWYGKHQMILSGNHVELDEKFIVARTLGEVKLLQDNFTDNEKAVVTHQAWLSLEQIINSKEPVYPAILKTHLASILQKYYPPEPVWVDLGLQP